MIRIFFVILLIYLIFRFIRNITVFTMRSRSVPKDDIEEPPPAPKQTKMIEKDEGEYVDYEELKD
ncbi:MAG: hypothetical protein WC865_08070 [Bacteroidales bacterium]